MWKHEGLWNTDLGEIIFTSKEGMKWLPIKLGMITHACNSSIQKAWGMAMSLWLLLAT